MQPALGGNHAVCCGRSTTPTTGRAQAACLTGDQENVRLFRSDVTLRAPAEPTASPHRSSLQTLCPCRPGIYERDLVGTPLLSTRGFGGKKVHRVF